MEQVPQECLILTDRCQLGDYARIEFMGVLWSKVAQPLPFQPTPQRLDGIEHRRVRGQLLQGQPIGEVIHQRADRVALMHAAAVPDDHESSGQLLHHRLQEGGHIPVIEVAVGQGMCEPTTHRGAWRVTTTVNASWRRVSAGTATCLVEKCRLLGHPLGSGELATGAWVDPPSAADRAFPAGIPGKTIPHLASPQSLLRHGNGSAGRNLHARRCVASATNLHDALSVRRDRNSTMRCRKKLYDALSVRRWRGTPNSSRINWPRRGAVHNLVSKPWCRGLSVSQRRAIFS